MRIAVGWKDATPEQLLVEAGEDAERTTNQPPRGLNVEASLALYETRGA